MSSTTATLGGVPSTQLGVIVSNDGSAKLENIPVSSPAPGEVLIKNVAVASNPKDWKIPGRFPKYAFVEGNDIAGTIVKVGEGVVEYIGGERVAAFTKMAKQDNKVNFHFRPH